VFLCFPIVGRVKVNTNETTSGCLKNVACEGLFRGSMEEFVDGFSSFHEVQKSFYANLMCAFLSFKHYKLVSYYHV